MKGGRGRRSSESNSGRRETFEHLPPQLSHWTLLTSTNTSNKITLHANIRYLHSMWCDMAYPSGRTWVNALPEPVGLSWFSELGQSPSDGMAAGEKGELRSLHQVSTWFWIFVQSTNDNQDLKAVYSILAHYAIHTSAVEVRSSCNLPSFNLKRVQKSSVSSYTHLQYTPCLGPTCKYCWCGMAAIDRSFSARKLRGGAALQTFVCFSLVECVHHAVCIC